MIPRRCSTPTLPLLIATMLLAIAPLAAHAEDDPFAGALFPPDLVMRHAVELELDGAQIAAIKEEIQKVQPLFLERQFDLQAELGRLRGLVDAARPDETAVLAELDRILDLEREIKRAQVGLLVRIKGILQPAQQERLRSIREKG